MFSHFFRWNQTNFLLITEKLGGGNSNMLYVHPYWGKMIQFDEHIFQMGWFNHQLEKDFPTEKKQNKTPQDFDLALGLHTCGLLADAILALARKRRSSVCLVPCCYGQAGPIGSFALGVLKIKIYVYIIYIYISHQWGFVF